ncbi:hypothetical protein [Streptosporangium sp. NPDC051022]|uniref:hypothetical protein n=1 Tax=Streptosporangium sp. NPDC051022 TaxID=3155752 RepID=UPI00341D85DB
MPPAKRKAPLPPVPGGEEPRAELCATCFPEGLAGTPEGATVVSCAHGAWRVSDLTDETDDPTPTEGEGGEQPPEDPGDGKGDGSK